MGGNGECFSTGQLSTTGGQLALELKAGRDTSVSTYRSTTNRIFGFYTSVGPKGLILGSSMALIPNEMIHDFLKGKSIDYIIM